MSAPAQRVKENPRAAAKRAQEGIKNLGPELVAQGVCRRKGGGDMGLVSDSGQVGKVGASTAICRLCAQLARIHGLELRAPLARYCLGTTAWLEPREFKGHGLDCCARGCSEISVQRLPVISMVELPI